MGLSHQTLKKTFDASVYCEEFAYAAAERYGQLSVEHKHIFSLHGLAPLLLTADVLVRPASLALIML